jgi:selenocysteine lyase/cysteine desulfurase
MTKDEDGDEGAFVRRWREDTPGCRERTHLNNAGAALMPREVLDAVRGHLEREAQIGGYEAADEAAHRVAEVYEALGALIGAPARDVAAVDSATRGVELVLGALELGAGDWIVTSRSDYPSNQIMLMALAERFGVQTVLAEELPEGGIDPESVRCLLRGRRCRLVCLSWVPTNSGLVQAAQAVGEVCAAAGVPYLLDACQCVGQMPIDVGRLRCDFLTASARKFLRGPRAVGFLYVSAAATERGLRPLLPDMRGAEWTAPGRFHLVPGARRFEQWELPYALLLGMGAAARYAAFVGPAGPRRAWDLAAGLRRRLEEAPWARVLDRGADPCAIVTAEIRGWHAEELRDRLRERRINTSAATRASGLLDMDAKAARSVLRISPHYYNTFAEVESCFEALSELAATRAGA